jgi:hypothetical protein
MNLEFQKDQAIDQSTNYIYIYIYSGIHISVNSFEMQNNNAGLSPDCEPYILLCTKQMELIKAKGINNQNNKHQNKQHAQLVNNV